MSVDLFVQVVRIEDCCPVSRVALDGGINLYRHFSNVGIIFSDASTGIEVANVTDIEKVLSSLSSRFFGYDDHYLPNILNWLEPIDTTKFMYWIVAEY
jgi:hypothetical protein